jgi:NADPH-dependent curcumin reductase CurA
MSSAKQKQIIAANLPEGALSLSDMRLVEADIPVPAEGELLVKLRILSIDPSNRVYMKQQTYRPQVGLNDVMGGFAIAEVIEARAPGFAPGDLVFADTGWTQYAAVPASGAVLLPRIEPLSHLVSLCGITAGFTAYIGMVRIGRPMAGETVVVSGAGGAVGSFAGQLAKIAGARVVGVAGGAEKCRLLKEQLGFDAVVDYKAGDLVSAMKKAAPDGIDVYFDNVAGEVLDVARSMMNRLGRIVFCGSISTYDSNAPSRRNMNVSQCSNVYLAHFLVLNFLDEYPAGIEQLSRWYKEGKIVVREDISQGIEEAPAALLKVLAGENRGKMMVNIS